MRTYYTLSFSHTILVGGERLYVYCWVHTNQIPPGGEQRNIIPEVGPGEIHRYLLPGEGLVSLKVLGEGREVRQLSRQEEKTGIVQIEGEPEEIIRLG